MSPSRLSRRRRALAVLVAATALLSACGGGAEPASTTASPSPGGSAAPTTGPGDAHADGHPAGGLPSPHVHGVGVNPADGRVHLATHDGLFRYDTDGPTRIGPVLDLMGFTIAGPDHFYASGHPGPGVDLPQPLGLIESTDGGQTWALRSRQGQSDFHALAASDVGVVGYDGTALRATRDGTTWQDLAPPVEPHALAASPDGSVLVATSPSGPVRSVDGGAGWAAVGRAPLLQLVDWADGQSVVGVTPDGTVAVSTDAGATWTRRGSLGGPPQAIGASAGAGGALRIVAVTPAGVVDSTDGGRSFAPLTT